MPDADDLAATLARLAAGDPAARDELFARTQLHLGRLAGRMLHGSFARVEAFEQTDDVMQSVFLRLLKSWDGVLAGDDGRPLADAAVYLSRVSRLVREVLIDMARSHHGRAGGRPARVPLDGEGGGADPGSDTHDPEPLAAWTEFHAAVGDLPEHLRRVVELRWYHDLGHDEIARLLGITSAASRKHWVSARLALARHLGRNLLSDSA